MTRGRENPACSITETGKRADSVRMLHSHHSPGTRPRDPEAPAVKREAEEDWRAMKVIHSAQFELSVRCSSFLSQTEGHRSAERAASEVQKS